jgi:hypothetical protein
MATVTGYTAAYTESQLDETIVDASLVGDNLVLEQRDGSTIDVGSVRGPAGTDAAPGDVAATAGTTPIRDTGGRVHVGTPTATDDATTKAYVDAADTSLDGRLDTLEGQTLDSRLDTLEGETLDARLDAIEAVTGKIRRNGSQIKTTDGSLSSSEYNISSVTISNPVNGRTYRIYAHGNIVPDTAATGTGVRIKHGISAVTGGTQIAQANVDHRVTGKSYFYSLMVEFTFTGTTGQASYNVVVTGAPTSNQSRHSAASTQPVVLIVDEIY